MTEPRKVHNDYTKCIYIHIYICTKVHTCSIQASLLPFCYVGCSLKLQLCTFFVIIIFLFFITLHLLLQRQSADRIEMFANVWIKRKMEISHCYKYSDLLQQHLTFSLGTVPPSINIYTFFRYRYILIFMCVDCSICFLATLNIEQFHIAFMFL